MKIKLVSKTTIDEDYLKELISQEKDEKFIENIQKAEGLAIYCARVSSPKQDNPEYEKLLNSCMKYGHWSVFQMIDITFEIETSRAIAQQILRHQFDFQEFSQRYSKADLGFEIYEARRQDKKNRQNSIDDMSEDDKEWFKIKQEQMQLLAYRDYEEALKRGIAKEQARFLLPLNVKTKMYMKGSLRSWLHYVNVRSDAATQKEHRDVANEIKRQLCSKFPVFSHAAGWIKTPLDFKYEGSSI